MVLSVNGSLAAFPADVDRPAREEAGLLDVLDLTRGVVAVGKRNVATRFASQAFDFRPRPFNLLPRVLIVARRQDWVRPRV